MHRALPHARSKRSVPHTRRLKVDPLVSNITPSSNSFDISSPIYFFARETIFFMAAIFQAVKLRRIQARGMKLRSPSTFFITSSSRASFHVSALWDWYSATLLCLSLGASISRCGSRKTISSLGKTPRRRRAKRRSECLARSAIQGRSIYRSADINVNERSISNGDEYIIGRGANWSHKITIAGRVPRAAIGTSIRVNECSFSCIFMTHSIVFDRLFFSLREILIGNSSSIIYSCSFFPVK